MRGPNIEGIGYVTGEIEGREYGTGGEHAFWRACGRFFQVLVVPVGDVDITGGVGDVGWMLACGIRMKQGGVGVSDGEHMFCCAHGDFLGALAAPFCDV